MAQTFPELSKEFHAAADKLAAGTGNYELTLAKYTLLMRHKTDTPEQKQELSRMLFDATIRKIDHVAKNLPTQRTFSQYQVNSLYAALRSVGDEENIRYMPGTGSTQVVDTTLTLLRALETFEKHDDITYENYNALRRNLTEFIHFAMDTAQNLKMAEDGLNKSLTTSQDMRLPKPLSIKGKTPDSGKP